MNEPKRAANDSTRALRVSNLKPYRKNTLRGFFTLHLPSGLTIHDMTWHEQGEKRWIGFPGRPYTKPDGTQSWAVVIELERAKMDRLRDAVLQLIDAEQQVSA